MNLAIDWGLGPYQYPYYPSIRVPEYLLPVIKQTGRYLDKNIILFSFGMSFLEEQLHMFANDTSIRGCHLANEWPDTNRVEDTRKKAQLSFHFMRECIATTQRITQKPLSMNTNIDVRRSTQAFDIFKKLFFSIEKRASLGLDVYPSQESWKKTPDIMIKKQCMPFPKQVKKVQQYLHPIRLSFAEVEAQPWGNGMSWYEIIQHSSNKEDILGFTPHFFKKILNEYIIPSELEDISLWGCEFWLVAKKMRVSWPMDIIQRYNFKKFP